MKTRSAVLEYCVIQSRGRRKWGFRFKSGNGRVLMDSVKKYPSQCEAEKGFISLIKRIASNQYKVDSSKSPKHDARN